MSTPLERAEQAVTEKRDRLHRSLLLVATGDEVLPDALDAGLAELMAAVREQVACEIEAAEFRAVTTPGSEHYRSGYTAGLGDGARIARDDIRTVTIAEQPAPVDRAAILREAADFLWDAHFRDGLGVQEIGTALRHMADETRHLAPADICQFHTPAGDPCAADGCGHAAGDDCHPRRTV